MLEWLDATWQKLNRIRTQGRLPHALLLIGADGIGKQQLAARLAESLLCENPHPDGRRCERCMACAWLQAGTHPDLMHLAPEEPGKAIKVDQIRSLCAGLAMTSHAGGTKVAIIRPADAMNANAANSLLKTLEEPTDNTLLVLLTAVPGKLPATIRSRCQQVRMLLPQAAPALRWLESNGVAPQQGERCLQMAGGAPLKALELARADLGELNERRLDELCQVASGRLDPVRLASSWHGNDEPQTLNWWLEWLRDLLRWQLAGQPPADASVARKLQKISESVDSRQIYGLADTLTTALNSLASGLNRQLILEELLIGWAQTAGVAYRRSNMGNG